jgi:glycyl-tRNA synthetase
MVNFIIEKKISCPKCGKHNFTGIREFNLMFETYRGILKDAKNIVYLRPENAQGEYVNFLNVMRSMRTKLPFAIGQIGKAFRNEITPGNFTFRTIEFEQMEFQTFCKNGDDEKIYADYKEIAKKFFNYIGLPDTKLRFHDHDKLAFYAKAACDIEYEFPFGYGEINGTHNRTNYDLTKHEEYSKKSMSYLDPETNEKFIPYIVESTVGADRAVLAVLFESYKEEQLEDGTIREIMAFPTYLAPYKVTVLPLIKKFHSAKANEVFDLLSRNFNTFYDEANTIGKRYHRSDIMGTPFAVTIDDNTLNENTVTVRDRDTMEQVTIKIDELVSYIEKRVKY